jgi:hypothetical protein
VLCVCRISLSLEKKIGISTVGGIASLVKLDSNSNNLPIDLSETDTLLSWMKIKKIPPQLEQMMPPPS